MKYSKQQKDALLNVARNREFKKLVKKTRDFYRRSLNLGICNGSLDDVDYLNRMSVYYAQFNALVKEYEKNPKLQSNLAPLQEFQFTLELLYENTLYTPYDMDDNTGSIPIDLNDDDEEYGGGIDNITKKYVDKLHKKGLQHEVIGGKVSISSLYNFIKNGYSSKKNNNVEGYQMDPELSGQRFQAYYNPEKDHLVTVHRGTQGINDWITDLKLALFNDKSGKRFQHAKQQQQLADEKYKDSQKSVIGHSLGAKLAQEANVNNNELIAYNGANTPYDVFNKKKENETHIRTNLDPISYFDTNNDITIPSKSINPLTEHTSEALKRLDPNMTIGGSLQAKNYKITKYSKDRAKELGVKIKLSKDKKKKIDIFDMNNNFITSIGDMKYPDYPTYIKSHGLEYANKRQRLYKQRHNKDLQNKNSAGWYSANILW